jgi:hypothetical protein
MRVMTIPMYKVFTTDESGEVDVSGQFHSEQVALAFYDFNVKAGYPTTIIYPDGKEIKENA